MVSYWGQFCTMSKSPVFLFLFISITITITITTFAQEAFRGIPHIRNYNRSEYHAGTQNWGIIQDQRGFLYFANNDGLLFFDGGEWNLSRISASSPLRSILVDSENRIYVGLINDFGVISRRDDKAVSYRSLKSLSLSYSKGYKYMEELKREGLVENRLSPPKYNLVE